MRGTGNGSCWLSERIRHRRRRSMVCCEGLVTSASHDEAACCCAAFCQLLAGAACGSFRKPSRSPSGASAAIFHCVGQPGSRSAIRFGGLCLRKVRAPWARRQVTPGHGGNVVTDSATENRPPQNIVVRVKRWGKSPPRFPVTEAARQTPPEQGQIGDEETSTPIKTSRVGCTRAEVTPLPEK